LKDKSRKKGAEREGERGGTNMKKRRTDPSFVS